MDKDKKGRWYLLVFNSAKPIYWLYTRLLIKASAFNCGQWKQLSNMRFNFNEVYANGIILLCIYNIKQFDKPMQ